MPSLPLDFEVYCEDMAVDNAMPPQPNKGEVMTTETDFPEEHALCRYRTACFHLGVNPPKEGFKEWFLSEEGSHLVTDAIYSIKGK